jgi:hypothetical protein
MLEESEAEMVMEEQVHVQEMPTLLDAPPRDLEGVEALGMALEGVEDTAVDNRLEVLQIKAAGAGARTT